jgi:hypothetical protein
VLPGIEVKELKEPVKEPSEKPKAKKKIVKAALPKSK